MIELFDDCYCQKVYSTEVAENKETDIVIRTEMSGVGGVGRRLYADR